MAAELVRRVDSPLVASQEDGFDIATGQNARKPSGRPVIMAPAWAATAVPLRSHVGQRSYGRSAVAVERFGVHEVVGLDAHNKPSDELIGNRSVYKGAEYAQMLVFGQRESGQDHHFW